MPFRRRRRRRGKRGPSKKLARMVRQIVNKSEETKRFVRSNVNQNLTTAGQVIDLFSIAQGVDENERVGNRIRLMGIRFKYEIVNAPGTTIHQIRLLIYKRKGPYDATNPITPGALMNAPMDQDLFVVKKDDYRTMSPITGPVCRKTFNYFKRWGSQSGGQLVSYHGANAIDLQSGNWQFAALSGTTTFELLTAMSVEVFYKDA